MASKCKGGLQLSNAKLYNLTCLARQAMDWISHTSFHSNYALEEALSHPWNLTALLHTKPSRLPQKLKENTLIKDTAVTWRTIRTKYNRDTTI